MPEISPDSPGRAASPRTRINDPDIFREEVKIPFMRNG